MSWSIPVNNERSPSIVNPEGTDEGQDQGHAGRDEAQHLEGKAHGLSRGQRRVPDLQDPLAGRQRLLQAAILRNQILIDKFFSLSKLKRD